MKNIQVILKPRILSPRNIFIVNLACSDLLLCVFTMPFSFIEISMRTWQMGESSSIILIQRVTTQNHLCEA